MKIVVAYPVELSPRHRAAIDAPPGVQVVHAPYEESYDRRTARRRGDLVEGDEERALVRSSAFGREIADADAVFALDLPTELAELAPRLRWIHAVGAGTDHLATVRIAGDVVITNSSGIGAEPIAEFVIARLLQMWRRLPDLDANQREHRWVPLTGTLASGKTLAIVGFGAIGQQVAVRTRALGLRVVGVRRTPTPHPAADAVVTPAELGRVLAESDAAVVCASLNDSSRALFDAAAFAAMKPGGIFCNISRGLTVDQDALVAALRTGHLQAAAIDVMYDEPLPSESELWDVPNLLISPHCSGATDRGHTAEALRLFGENLRRWIAGEPLLNRIAR